MFHAGDAEAIDELFAGVPDANGNTGYPQALHLRDDQTGDLLECGVFDVRC